MTDLYDTLGIARDATDADVRAAYRRASKTAHPDAGGTAEAFQAVSLAHRVLSDKERRAKYDKDGTADDSPDNAAPQAMNMVAQVMAGLFECDDAIYSDLIGSAKASIQQMMRDLTANIKKAERDGEKARKLRARFSVKAGPNHIGNMLDQRIAQIEAAIEDADTHLSVMKAALAIVSDALFDPEPLPQRQYAQNGFATGNFAGINAGTTAYR